MKKDKIMDAASTIQQLPIKRDHNISLACEYKKITICETDHSYLYDSSTLPTNERVDLNNRDGSIFPDLLKTNNISDDTKICIRACPHSEFTQIIAHAI